MKKIMIIVDLGHFKAYMVSKNPLESAKVDLIKNYDTIEAHLRLGEKLSDEAGRFGMNGGKKGIKGYGEPHNLELEIEKKLIKLIAKDIDDLIKKEDCKRWYLAASKKINKQIIKNLDPAIKAKLSKNVSSDLTKTKKSELLSHFE